MGEHGPNPEIYLQMEEKKFYLYACLEGTDILLSWKPQGAFGTQGFWFFLDTSSF